MTDRPTKITFAEMREQGARHQQSYSLSQLRFGTLLLQTNVSIPALRDERAASFSPRREAP
jgi:hypothetical protein